MTIAENKALIQCWIDDVWNTGNLTPITDIFAPSYTVNGTFVGPAGVKDAVAWLHTTFAEARVTVDEMVAEDDKVVVSWVLHGIHRGPFMDIPATNKAVTLAGINIYRVTEGKIVSNTECVNVLGLLHQLGTHIGPGEMSQPI